MAPLSTFIRLAFVAPVTSRAILGPYQSASTTSLLPAWQPRDFHTGFWNFSAGITTGDEFDPDDEWGLESDPEDDEEDGLTPDQKEAVWCKAKSRGVQLTKAMMMNDQDAATMLQWPYTQSPWDGDLRDELKKWGYKDDFEGDVEIDKQCDFDKTQEMADAFEELGVDPRSALGGGPNDCYYVQHNDGPVVYRDEDGELPDHDEQYYNVDGKELRV